MIQSALDHADKNESVDAAPNNISADDEDRFEEITESREIIEDRINRLKLQMIDITVK